MTYRKLRIAWSVACGIVAVLLCVLWVRSHWRHDSLAVAVSRSTLLVVGSDRGALKLGRGHNFPGALDGHWESAF